MLVLSRKQGETIRIGDDIEVTVLATIGNRVRLGIVAPRRVNIVRKEITQGGHQSLIVSAALATSDEVCEIELDAHLI